MVEIKSNTPTGHELGISGNFGIKTNTRTFDVYLMTASSESINCPDCEADQQICPISQILAKAKCPEQSLVGKTPNCNIIKVTAIKVY